MNRQFPMQRGGVINKRIPAGLVLLIGVNVRVVPEAGGFNPLASQGVDTVNAAWGAAGVKKQTHYKNLAILTDDPIIAQSKPVVKAAEMKFRFSWMLVLTNFRAGNFANCSLRLSGKHDKIKAINPFVLVELNKEFWKHMVDIKEKRDKRSGAAFLRRYSVDKPTQRR